MMASRTALLTFTSDWSDCIGNGTAVCVRHGSGIGQQFVAGQQWCRVWCLTSSSLKGSVHRQLLVDVRNHDTRAGILPANRFATLVFSCCAVVLAGHHLHAQARNVLMCEGVADSLPSVGIYGFFHDAEQTLCVAPSDDADGTDVPCLRMGQIHVGQTRESVEERLGSAFQDIEPRLPGFTTSAYMVFRDTVANEATYYVVEYEQLNNREIAFSVQLTGTRPDTMHHFSCLHLEDDEAALRRQLGEPTDISPFEFEEDGVSGVVWSYAPVPISIEVVNGKVFSFRVWRPEYVEPKERRLSLLEHR